MGSALAQRSIRFGGGEIDGAFRYELTGGRLCLDLVNTFDERDGVGRELLPTYDRLLEWSAQAGALPHEVLAPLRKAAGGEPVKASHALNEVRAFRELLFDLLREIASSRRPSKRHLESFNRFLARSGQRRRMAFVDGALAMAQDKGDLVAPLWPVIEDAAELLSDGELLGRLRMCAGPGCAWMFIDRSRRANRRWCDMSVCGNRAKARRYRASGRRTRT